jgi:hypothetical protein
MAKRLTKAQAIQEYTKWHWGKAPKAVIRWNDSAYPQKIMPECGRLVELRVKQPGKRAATRIVLTNPEANGSHLVFDPTHRNQRLYVFSHPKFREKMRTKYGMRENYAPSHKLAAIAKAVGGHHGTSDYPSLTGQWIGELTHVIYATDKEGDGFSFYIHKMGEEGGKRPHLVVDGQGRCWIVGGDYTVEEGGITN